MSVNTNPLAKLVPEGETGPFLTTRHNERIYYASFTADNVRLPDIAAHLSCINRWIGAIGPFSVAQHCVQLADHALTTFTGAFPSQLSAVLDSLRERDARESEQHTRRRFAFALLMHDVDEYITNDFPGPLKQFFPLLSEYGDYVRSVVWQKYSIDPHWYSYCKEWDRRILINEAEWGLGTRDAISPKPSEKLSHIKGLTIKIDRHAWTPQDAEQRFINMFARLQ